MILSNFSFCARALASKDDALQRIREAGVIAIFRVDSPQNCIPAMEALVKGGLPIFEVTMTTPGALDLVSEARSRFGGEALVGAGTVLNRREAEEALAAGAQFVVSPSLDKDVVELCSARGVLSCPGTFTATEIVQAWEWGADLVKVFPISQVGPGYIKALRGPLPKVRLVPTGGVDAGNLGEYLNAGAFAVGIGGGLIPVRAVAEGRYEEVTQAAVAVTEAVRKARGR